MHRFLNSTSNHNNCKKSLKMQALKITTEHPAITANVENENKNIL